MRVAAIMPCRGRAEQTIRNVKRLLATAGDVEWQLICVGTRNDVGPIAFDGMPGPDRLYRVAAGNDRVTYWQALTAAMHETDAPLIANLANDLLPGQHWLQRAVRDYQQAFGDGPGMLGFNDGHHEVDHSPHFLIHRDLLARYGGWPVWYDHNYGDTELCQRAIEDELYVKSPWATLFHDHPYFGGQDDTVYQEGRASSERDGRIYAQRRASGWPHVSL